MRYPASLIVAPSKIWLFKIWLRLFPLPHAKEDILFGIIGARWDILASAVKLVQITNSPAWQPTERTTLSAAIDTCREAMCFQLETVEACDTKLKEFRPMGESLFLAVCRNAANAPAGHDEFEFRKKISEDAAKDLNTDDHARYMKEADDIFMNIDAIADQVNLKTLVGRALEAHPFAPRADQV